MRRPSASAGLAVTFFAVDFSAAATLAVDADFLAGAFFAGAFRTAAVFSGAVSAGAGAGAPTSVPTSAPTAFPTAFLVVPAVFFATMAAAPSHTVIIARESCRNDKSTPAPRQRGAHPARSTCIRCAHPAAR